MLKVIAIVSLQSTNTEENTDASEGGNLDQVEYEENEDGSKLGRLFFTVLYKNSYIHVYILSFQMYCFFCSSIYISVLGEVQFWEDGVDCDNQQVLKSSSQGQHQQDQVRKLGIKLVAGIYCVSCDECVCEHLMCDLISDFTWYAMYAIY